MTDIGTGAPYTIQNTIPSYLYRQYADDDALQAFVDAENAATQAYVDWFNQINLPIYTSATISGELLDWVGVGLYGMRRPVFSVARHASKGPFNTVVFNTLPFNGGQLSAQAYYTANDDIYKRTITWQFYKGDGFQFTIDWLKRRIVRFLNGTNGTAPPIDNTYQVSVTFGAGAVVNIGILPGVSSFLGGSVPNGGALNTFTPNQTNVRYAAYPVSPALSALIAGVQSGVLPLPFQFSFMVST